MQIEVLGPIQARDSAQIDLDRPSQRRLLAILSLDAGRRVSTDALIDRFWPEQAPATAKAALQTHVSALRRLLGNGTIVTEGHGYRLDAAAVHIDSSEFLGLATEAKTAVDGQEWDPARVAAEEALNLWRGQPFGDLIDDDFARPTIAKLKETRLELLEMRAEAHLGLGRPADALPDLESLVIEYPLRERLWEHLMTARYRLGRHTEALHAYQEVSGHLGEMGLEPGGRLRRLEERILLHDKTLTPARHNLPVELSDFIGREGEMDQTRKLLSAHRLVTLTGAGGSGKTRLAVQAAKGQLDHFPEGVWLVELAATQDSDLVPTEIARAMGLKPKGEDALEVIAEAIASEKILIILDNCEHLLDGAAATVQRLLQASTDLKILATSREPLRVPGESSYEIPGLAFPTDGPSDPKVALEYEAIRLFERRAELANPAFAVDGQNLSAVVSICERLDGMPLAIELAAARTRSLGVETIAARLDDQLQLLTRGSSTAPPRQQTLQATIEWSYRLLDPSEQTILNRLSVFRGGFQLDAAEQVVSGVSLAPGQVTAIVSDLVEKSLVTTYETRLGTRYRLLETVRRYADLRLREAGETTIINDSLVRWCLTCIDGLWQRALGGGQADLIQTLGSESDNLQAALEWSASKGDDPAVVALSQALGWHWYFTGHLDNAATALRTGLEAASDKRDEALNLTLLARSLAYSEDIPGAISVAESAHRLLPHLDSALAKTWVVFTTLLGQFMSVETDPGAMLPLAAEAADLALGEGDIYAEILARQIMADAYCWNGRTEEGLEQQRIAIDQAVSTGDETTIDRTYGLSIYNFMLDPVARRTEPLRVIEDWMSLVPQDVDSGMSTATDWIPWVYIQAGDFDRADEAAARMGNRTLEGYNRTIYLMVRSSMSWVRGNLREARQGVEELEKRGVSPRWAHSYYPLAADIAADRGQLDDAREVADAYLEMSVHSTGEAAKLGVLNPLVRAEVDAAIETGSNEHVEQAQHSLAQMHRILEEHPPLVDSWTSVMTHTQNIAFAEAEMTRITGPSPESWAEALAVADYAYYRLYARWRLAEALLQSGEHQEGASELNDVHVEVARIGAQLLRTRVKKTGRDYGVRVGQESAD
ncbi:MAG: BTAD domain-containing putative transcriptional regulator [Actinomycetota bacterium]|nr:BTAD domain-containing putative transcriptional regulator [Actinomycetota bacterium]